ncbi:DUF6074 family protein [Brevundimonas sp. P7753]|uniref:DUF6074 family protein n=1 Tax=Brevundimonas sp. P7753 TaxID=2726982 RepID=UPI00351BABEB
MAEVIPFPLAARQAFVTRQAVIALGLPPDAAERHILRMVREQSEVLRRKGVADDRVTHEGAALEGAIRAALWKAVLTPGGAA